MEENTIFKHARLVKTEEELPLVFEIDEGYRRVCSYRMEKDNVAVIFGVSNIKAEKPSGKYKQKEGEETNLLCGVVIDKPEFAKIIGDYFIRIGEQMEYERGEEIEKGR